MTIYIIGFMGSGKTFLGRELAQYLKQPFYDLDQLIEEQEKQTISELFAEKGEVYFRSIEEKLLDQWQKTGVIATGGGIIETEKNRLMFQQDQNITIWLNPAWQILLQNLKTATDRPLLDKLTETELPELWQKRIPLYKECADIVVNDPDLDKLISSISIYKKLHS